MKTPSVISDLVRHEATIERGLATFVEVGNALLAIRDERLYRETHSTFEEYCRERWDFGRRRANELISSAEVVGAIAPTGLPSPSNEAQARELAKVPDPERTDVWREALDQTGGKPTAAAIRAVASPAPERATPPAPAPAPVRPVEPTPMPARPVTVEPEPTPARPVFMPAEKPEPRQENALAAVLAGNPSREAAEYRRNLLTALDRVFAVVQFDPDRVGDLIAEDHAMLIDSAAQRIGEWAAQVRRRRTGLHVVGRSGR